MLGIPGEVGRSGEENKRKFRKKSWRRKQGKKRERDEYVEGKQGGEQKGLVSKQSSKDLSLSLVLNLQPQGPRGKNSPMVLF